MDDSNTIDGVGTSQEGPEGLNLEKDLQELGLESDDSESTEETGKSAEVLKQERADAITEAIKHSKESKSARADAEYYKTYAQVADDPNSIISIRERDASMADRIAQEKWGMSYDDLIAKANEGEEPSETTKSTPRYTESDIERIVEKKLQEKNTTSEKQRIEDYTIDFFIQNDVDVKSPTFKNIMEEFDTYAPKNAGQAEKLLTMLYREQTGRNSTAVGNIESVSFPRNSGRKTYSKSSAYKDAAKTAKSLGMDLTEADFKKYG